MQGAEQTSEFKKLFKKPLMQSVEMTAEVRSEATEIVTMAIDKYTKTRNYEKAAELIKNAMDKKFGPSWHCCIGEGFGYEVTYQSKSLLTMFYGEKLGVLLYKC
eukprot:TRINITY_DN774851_c0_g1_i1.p1 TRINITY_DN774851_c0_g1~~TRINITY_DN774851_c0_g1_i1.p1  ORF type:complete len:104 (-),score=9.13 TRINITY_DN774851_c0_g1_i1:103-414(-)